MCTFWRYWDFFCSHILLRKGFVSWDLFQIWGFFLSSKIIFDCCVMVRWIYMTLLMERGVITDCERLWVLSVFLEISRIKHFTSVMKEHFTNLYVNEIFHVGFHIIYVILVNIKEPRERSIHYWPIGLIQRKVYW